MTTLNTAVVAPMPTAKVAMAPRLNPGALRRDLTARRMSLSKLDMSGSPRLRSILSAFDRPQSLTYLSRD